MEKRKELEIKPINFDEMSQKLKDNRDESGYLSLLEEDVKNISKYAFAPYFWFVSTRNFNVLASSENLHQLTPFEGDEWKEIDNFLSKIMPEDDLNYFYGATYFMMEFLKKLNNEERDHYKYTIYGRMLDKNNNMRWVAFQSPKILYDDLGVPVCGLVTITDLGIFDVINKPRLTILNVLEEKNPYYSVILEENKIQKEQFPKITNREKEILSYVVQGMSTPQIADKLFISHHTVDNHKKNLRAKTECKTIAEVVNYVVKNQLI